MLLVFSFANFYFFFFIENDDDDDDGSKSDDDEDEDDDDDDDDEKTSSESSAVCLWRRWNFLPRGGGGELLFRERGKDDDENAFNGFTNGEKKKGRNARAERGDVRRGAAGVSREQQQRRRRTRRRRSRWSRYARVLVLFSFLFSFVTRVSQGKAAAENLVFQPFSSLTVTKK